MLSIIISLISGIILSLAFPRANLHWLAWFGLSPLMYYTYKLSWRKAILCSTAFGIGFFASLLYWISIWGHLPWIALAVFQAFFIVAFTASAKLLGSRLGSWGRLLLLPSLWVVFEWLRSLGVLGFTWGDIGYSQYKDLPAIQLASLTGIWGVSFLLAMSNAAIANFALDRKSHSHSRSALFQLILAGLIVLTVIGTGWNSLYTHSDKLKHPIKTAVIQGNIPQDTIENVEFSDRTWKTYERLTLSGEKDGVDLVIWPETVVPGLLARNRFTQERLRYLTSKTGASLLVGGWDEDKQGQVYNSAFLINPKDGLSGRYYKVHLVPFGEFVPVRRYIPFLSRYKVTPHDTSPGTRYNILDTGDYQIGTAICFESIFPDISRRLTSAGADILCIITNDCWYDQTPAAEQHMTMSIFRAVENRRFVVRGATTGISCIIDPCGRIVSSKGVDRSGIVESEIGAIFGKTFYTEHGDWLIYLSIVLIIILGSINIKTAISRKKP